MSLSAAAAATVGLSLSDVGWGHHMDGWGSGWWILMAFLMVAFWGLVIFGVVLLVRSGAWNRRGGGDSAIELLERRLANGEISPEEYRERRALLTGEPAGRERGGPE